MKVILFSLLALVSTTALQAEISHTYENRYTFRCIPILDDTKCNVKMSPATFEALVTTAFNAPNTNTEPLIELMHRIKDGKISHNLSKEYTRITHKDFYYRLLPYIPLAHYWVSVLSRSDVWHYSVKVNGKEAYLTVNTAGDLDGKVNEQVFSITYKN